MEWKKCDRNYIYETYLYDRIHKLFKWDSGAY